LHSASIRKEVNMASYSHETPGDLLETLKIIFIALFTIIREALKPKNDGEDEG
jgi:hypothetical protein